MARNTMVYAGTAVVIIKCCRQHTNALVITYIMNLKGLREGGRCQGREELECGEECERQQQQPGEYNGAGTTASAAQAAQADPAAAAAE